MTGPNPDAELDQALGLDQLPPAAPTGDQRQAGQRLVRAWREAQEADPGYDDEHLGEWIAEALAVEAQRAVARVLAERAAAGVRLDGRVLAAREDYGELTRAAEAHLAACPAARADRTATGLPFAVDEARRRLATS